MDGCPISFGPNLQSRPNPTLTSATWITETGAILLALIWSADMDINFLPANASWLLLIDDTARAIITPTWATPTRLNLLSATGPGPVSTVTLQLLVQDPSLHDDHLIPVLPFDPIAVPEQ